MKRLFIISFLLTVYIVLTACDTPLNEYKPKNDDEKQIVALLNDYQTARNSNDIEKLQSTFHDDGVYISRDGIEWSKSKMKETPEEWYKAKGSLEEIGKVELYNTKISVDGDKAKVFTEANYGKVYKWAHNYTLVKENNDWLIMKME